MACCKMFIAVGWYICTVEAVLALPNDRLMEKRQKYCTKKEKKYVECESGIKSFGMFENS